MKNLYIIAHLFTKRFYKCCVVFDCALFSYFRHDMAAVQSLVDKKKKNFIGLPAPLGYVPGLGRG